MKLVDSRLYDLIPVTKFAINPQKSVFLTQGIHSNDIFLHMKNQNLKSARQDTRMRYGKFLQKI